MNRGGSVGIATGWMARVRFLRGKSFFFYAQRPDSYIMDTWGLLGVKAAVR
jgi:hypothetical protein